MLSCVVKCWKAQELPENEQKWIHMYQARLIYGTENHLGLKYKSKLLPAAVDNVESDVERYKIAITERVMGMGLAKRRFQKQTRMKMEKESAWHRTVYSNP